MHKSVIQPGFVVLLDGCSSAGKTTIAQLLQNAASQWSFLHVKLDAFREMEPPNYFANDAKDQHQAREAALCHAVNACVAQFGLHGQNVVLDHVLNERARRWLEEDLRELQVLRVCVHCDLPELERRESARGDRPLGLAKSQFQRSLLDWPHHFAVNTTRTGGSECAQEIIAWLATQVRDSPL
jgi:chloramphenicol 3-O phosphotransferase